MTCPGVLVCVGREAFSPTLVNFIRKNSEEKLPGLGSRSSGLGPRTPGNGARSPAMQGARSPPHGTQSRASEYSEGHDSKKNGESVHPTVGFSEGHKTYFLLCFLLLVHAVNFGLKTKKSIIHPRSDSSNRSTRFSLSSDKSYSNGVGTDPQARPAVMNEDIEKRVLVNKDGSLSVEMRVRFRLQSDETLQWSTQIQKRPSLTNECCPLSQTQPHYLQQAQSESCSDPDSISYDPEAVDYSTQQVLGGNHCPCCYQRQEQQYDLWENPVHSHKYAPVPHPHVTSHSHTVMRHTHSSSSSSSCNSRRVVRCRARLSNCGGDISSEQGHLVQEEMCMTEHLEHRVEVEQNGDTHVEVCRVSRCCSRSSEIVATDSNLRPSSGKSVDDELKMEEGEEPALSTVSSSSHVLQSFIEDPDDDLPPSASQCSHRNEFATAADIQPAGNTCDGCVQGEGNGSRAVSAGSPCHCGASSPHCLAKGKEQMEAPQSCHSRMSRASCKSSKSQIAASEGPADEADEVMTRVASGMSSHTGLSGDFAQSGSSCICPNCGGCKTSRASNRSDHSSHGSQNTATPVSKQDNGSDGSEDDSGANDSAVSTQSNKSNLTNIGLPNELEERASSASSTRSHKSSCYGRISAGAEGERSPSTQSQKSKCGITAEKNDSKSAEETERVSSCLSAKCALSDKSNISGKLGKAERPNSAISAKSNESKVSVNSGTSHRSTVCSHCGRAASTDKAKPIVETTQLGGAIETEERTPSVLSAKSGKTSEKSISPRVEIEGEERVMSQMSGRSIKSNLSVKSSKPSCNGSCKSHKSNCSQSPEARPEVDDQTGDGEEHQERAASALSAKSDSTSKSNDEATLRGVSPSTNEVKAEEGTANCRTPSAMSGNSHTSAMSSKSLRSNCTSALLNPNQDTGPSTEADSDEKQTQERVASAMSAKSKSSARSGTSHKSKSSLSVKTLFPNVVTIKTPEDEEGHDTAQRAQSSVSTKSGKSNVSHKSGKDTAADVDETDADEDNRPISKSSQHSNSQSLSGTRAGEARGPSALSVHSIKSAKSGRSKCSCGTASVKKVEKEEQEDKEAKNEEAVSIRSPSTQRARIESGGSDQPLSPTSSGSVSLGLPADTAESDSGKSGVSCHVTSDAPNEESILNEHAMETESTVSRKSKNAESVLSQNNPAVEIPGRTEDKSEESGEKGAGRASSAVSVKSSRSKKSPCSCRTEAGSVKSSSKTEVHETNNTDNGTVSALSSKTAKARSKSPRSASAKSVTPIENKPVSRPASEAIEKESQSPCCLLPESAASAAQDTLITDKSPRANSRSSVKTTSSQKEDTPLKSSSPCSLHTPKPGSKVKTCSESTLSQSLSAADLLKETMSVPRPHSQQSKASKTSQKIKCKKGRESRNQDRQEDTEDLTPACLPNASPSEVVSDWLRSIPANSTMLTLGDEEEGRDKGVGENAGEETAMEEASPGDEEIIGEEGEGVEEVEGEEATESKSLGPVPGDPVHNSYPHTLLLKGEPLPRNWQSSTAVMKVLLSSSLGRCRSLPEVSNTP